MAMIANESLLAQMPGLVFWKDTNGVYGGANQAFLEFSGVQHSKIEGLTDFNLPWEAYAELYQQGDMEAMAHCAALRSFVPLYHKGSILTALDTKKSLLDSQGNVVGLAGSVTIIGAANLNQ